MKMISEKNSKVIQKHDRETKGDKKETRKVQEQVEEREGCRGNNTRKKKKRWQDNR